MALGDFPGTIISSIVAQFRFHNDVYGAGFSMGQCLFKDKLPK
jgi:hypothetical protein